MYKAYKTEVFSKWHDSLKDLKGKIAIARRIDRAEKGNFGDSEPVGEGVFELRVDFGPGYRVYYILKDSEMIILLCGGDKSSQKRDIDKAKEIAKEYRQ
jgi:putative addiction module killer protein